MTQHRSLEMAGFGGEKFESVVITRGDVEWWRTLRNAKEVCSLGSTPKCDGRPIDMDLALAANDGDVEKVTSLVLKNTCCPPSPFTRLTCANATEDDAGN